MTQAARRAYILGSNGPPGKGRLSYAVSDAERLARTLSARRCNFVVSRPKKDASALEVWTSLYAAIEQCETADTFVCSFSGHGLLDRGELFLLWDSSDPRKLLQTALPANQLFGALDRCNASSKLLILDCCHAGGILSKGFKSSSVPIADITNIDQNYLLLLASERLELARELKTEKGGFLTAAVCRALEDSNLQADSDEDGQISVDDLILTLRKAAQDHNRHNPKARVPTPILFGKNKSPVLLTARPTWKPWHFMLSGIDMVLLPIKMRRAVIGEDEVVAVSKGPITNGQYKAFVEDIDSRESFHGEPRQAPHGAVFDRETSRWITGFMPWSDPLFLADDKPVVCVSYGEAMAFCSWLSARVAGSWYGEAKTHDVPLSRTRDPRYSVRLPTPEIWDVAAFGRSTPYAVAGAEGTTRLRPGVNGRQAQIHQMKHCPAGRQDADLRTNALGVVDLFGNVWEWCISSTNLNHFSAIIAISGGSASHFGDVEPATVEIRGGGYLDDLSMIRPSARAVELQDQLETRHSDLGFRIAVSLDPTLLSEEIQEALAEHAIYVTADAYTHVASGQ